MALSSISSEEIWSKSGRLETASSEVSSVSRISTVDSKFNLGLSIQGQKGCEIHPLPHSRGRNYHLSLKYCEII